MATPTDGTPTPQEVVDLATKQVDLDRTALIGIFGTTAIPGALVRMPGGTFTRVNIGDNLVGGTVAAIDKDRIIVSRLGKDLVLSMPQS